jgi:hypothetical protein
MILSGSPPGLLQKTEENCLLQADTFRDNNVFALSNSILTPEFVSKKVEKPETRALLQDLH